MKMNGQTLAWLFTNISNGLWLFVFIPQFINNYKLKSGEALSLVLLLCLLFGDICSIMSASAKGLNVIIIYAGVYHIILDIIMISQVIYYRIYRVLNEDDLILEETVPLLGTRNTVVRDCDVLTFNECIFVVCSSMIVLLSELLIFYNFTIVADIIGWIATFTFMIARIPQIMLNHNRKSTAGLSLLSFIIMNIANILFLLSVLIILIDIDENKYCEYITNNIQWIVGSASTNIFDAIIFYQFYIYNRIS
jgi:uncharacterized protein with PQ loop repeat